VLCTSCLERRASCLELGVWSVVLGALFFTAKRFRNKAQGCFNPGKGPSQFDQPGTGCALNNSRACTSGGASALRLNRYYAARPRVEATLGFVTKPLRGKEQSTKYNEQNTKHAVQKLNRSIFSLLKMNGAPSRTSSSTTAIFPSRPALISLSPNFSSPLLNAFAAYTVR